MLTPAALAAVLTLGGVLYLPSARLEGTVRDKRGPIDGARVELVGTRFTTVTSHDGHFSLGMVAAGDYTMRVMRIGYRPLIVPHVIVGDSAATPLELTLERAPVPLAAVVVTPGYFGIMQPSIATPHTLTRQDIETVPQIGDDIYRAITRIPGVSADDYSAKFGVRGATGDALYVTLDGLQLVEPFHLRDLQGSLSIIDIQTLGGAELTTGGPGAEYGDQLAGVFAMHSLEPRTDRTRTSLGVSLMNARIMQEGGFANGRGGWLFSARRGYIDIALKIVSASDSLDPRFYDVFGKVQYDFGRAGTVALHGLLARDNMRYLDGPDHIDNNYGSAYTWLTWDQSIGDRLKQQTVASLGHLDWTRAAESTNRFSVDDDRVMRLSNLRQDWSLSLTSRALLKAGLDAGHQSADYDYASWQRISFVDANNQVQQRFDSVDIAIAPDGNRFGAYVAQRLRPIDAVTVEAGLRYDAGQQRGGPQWGSRFNAAWEPRVGTAVRGAWGLYTQAHPLFAMQVEDGEREFHQAERAEQRVIGIEQALPKRLAARVEFYNRYIPNPRPRHVTVSGNIDMVPELSWDRVLLAPDAARARGVEVSVGHEGARHVDWSTAYVLSSSDVELGGTWIPQQMDQRHALRTDWAFHPENNKWRLTVATQWHSGWPFTPPITDIDTLANTPQQFSLFAKLRPGQFNSDRLPSYNRIDMRWTRFIETRRGRVSFFVELFNMLNAQNTRGVDEFINVNNRKVTKGREPETMLPRLPSIGLTWQF